MPDRSLRFMLYGEDVSASKAMDKTGKQAITTGSRVSAGLASIGNAIGGEVGGLLSQVSMGLDNIAGGGKAAKLAAAGVAVTGIGAALTLLGSGRVQAERQLEAAIKASGHSYDDYKGAIAKTVGEMQNFGHGEEDTMQALQKLTAATNDPKKALADMGIAADLAASKHISLSEASQLVMRILGGSGTKILKQYGVQTSSATKTVELQRKAFLDHKTGLIKYHEVLTTVTNKTGNVTAQLAELSAKLRGQASAAVDSWGGRLLVARTKLGDMAAAVGEKVGPALTALGPVMAISGSIMSLMAARATASAAASAADAAAKTGETVATEETAVAQDTLNASLLANPIGLVVLAIVALIAIFVVAYKKVSWFRDGVNDVFKFITRIIGDAVTWIKSHWQIVAIILLGPFAAGLLLIKPLLGFGKGLFGIIADVISWVRTNWGTLLGILLAPFNLFKTLLGPIINGIMAVIGPIITAISKVVGFLTGAKGKSSSGITGTGVGAGAGGSVVPGKRFASGGIITRPIFSTAGTFGEAGPEAVIPLKANLLGREGTTVNVYVPHGFVGSATQIAAAITTAFATAAGQGHRHVLPVGIM